MSNNPMTRIHNADTGEIIDREMTPDELTAYKNHNQVLKELTDKAEAAKIAAEIKLTALGLTLDDVTALGL
tara:strand:+ start:692 stop:904 length:213 start_codon:yes stop_codon:yes gene_type:complete